MACGAGVKDKGLDPDEAIARQLGLGKASEMSELQEKYKDKMKDRLAEVYQHQSCQLFVFVHVPSQMYVSFDGGLFSKMAAIRQLGACGK